MIATNAFKQAVSGTYTASDTVIELNSISDTVGASDYLPDGGFNLILYDGLFSNPADANNAGKYEILECSSVNYATNEITVVREVENTTAVTIDASSWQVVYGATVEFFAQFEDADATILKQADVVDTLVSTSVIAPLSANQGKELQDTKIPTADIINDLTTGGATKVLSAEQGKELKDQLDAKGKVLDVKSATKTDTFSYAAASVWTDVTGLSVTITPKSATSTIYVMFNVNVSVSFSGNYIHARVLRGATPVGVGDAAGDRQRSSAGNHSNTESTTLRIHNLNARFSDSPASTSAQTYKIQLFTTSVNTNYVNRADADSDNAIFPRLISNITLIEVE